MDCAKIGEVILCLRKERGMTQKALAQHLCVTDKAVSKWERGLGSPDISLLAKISDVLGADLAALLSGDLPEEHTGGNMKKTLYYVCPHCGAIAAVNGPMELSCCGRKLSALTPQKAVEDEKFHLEQVEDEWFITTDHPMTKAHHIAFLAFVTGDTLQLLRRYPEWDLQARIPARSHGTLLWYCTQHGLFYQYI